MRDPPKLYGNMPTMVHNPPAPPPLPPPVASDAGEAPPDDDKEAERVFHSFDRDRSGDIDARELDTMLNELGIRADSAEATRVLARYDADGSGRLELGEFKKLAKSLRAFAAARPEVAPPSPARPSVGVPADVKQIFDRFDTDRSGDIDASELQSALYADRVLRRALVRLLL